MSSAVSSAMVPAKKITKHESKPKDKVKKIQATSNGKNDPSNQGKKTSSNIKSLIGYCKRVESKVSSREGQEQCVVRSNRPSGIGCTGNSQKKKPRRSSIGCSQELEQPTKMSVTQMASPPSVSVVTTSNAQIKELPKSTEEPANGKPGQKDQHAQETEKCETPVHSKVIHEVIPESSSKSIMGSSGNSDYSLQCYDRTFDPFQIHQDGKITESEDDLPSMSTALHSFIRQQSEKNRNDYTKDSKADDDLATGQGLTKASPLSEVTQSKDSQDEKSHNSLTSKDSCISLNISAAMTKDSSESCVDNDDVSKGKWRRKSVPISSTPNATKTMPRVIKAGELEDVMLENEVQRSTKQVQQEENLSSTHCVKKVLRRPKLLLTGRDSDKGDARKWPQKYIGTYSPADRLEGALCHSNVHLFGKSSQPVPTLQTIITEKSLNTDVNNNSSKFLSKNVNNNDCTEEKTKKRVFQNKGSEISFEDLANRTSVVEQKWTPKPYRKENVRRKSRTGGQSVAGAFYMNSFTEGNPGALGNHYNDPDKDITSDETQGDGNLSACHSLAGKEHHMESYIGGIVDAGNQSCSNIFHESVMADGLCIKQEKCYSITESDSTRSVSTGDTISSTGNTSGPLTSSYEGHGNTTTSDEYVTIDLCNSENEDSSRQLHRSEGSVIIISDDEVDSKACIMDKLPRDIENLHRRTDNKQNWELRLAKLEHKLDKLQNLLPGEGTDDIRCKEERSASSWEGESKLSALESKVDILTAQLAQSDFGVHRRLSGAGHGNNHFMAGNMTQRRIMGPSPSSYGQARRPMGSSLQYSHITPMAPSPLYNHACPQQRSSIAEQDRNMPMMLNYGIYNQPMPRFGQASFDSGRLLQRTRMDHVFGGKPFGSQVGEGSSPFSYERCWSGPNVSQVYNTPDSTNMNSWNRWQEQNPQVSSFAPGGMWRDEYLRRSCSPKKRYLSTPDSQNHYFNMKSSELGQGRWKSCVSKMREHDDSSDHQQISMLQRQGNNRDIPERFDRSEAYADAYILNEKSLKTGEKDRQFYFGKPSYMDQVDINKEVYTKKRARSSCTEDRYWSSLYDRYQCSPSTSRGDEIYGRKMSWSPRKGRSSFEEKRVRIAEGYLNLSGDRYEKDSSGSWKKHRKDRSRSPRNEKVRDKTKKRSWSPEEKDRERKSRPKERKSRQDDDKHRNQSRKKKSKDRQLCSSSEERGCTDNAKKTKESTSSRNVHKHKRQQGTRESLTSTRQQGTRESLTSTSSVEKVRDASMSGFKKRMKQGAIDSSTPNRADITNCSEGKTVSPGLNLSLLSFSSDLYGSTPFSHENISSEERPSHNTLEMSHSTNREAENTDYSLASLSTSSKHQKHRGDYLSTPVVCADKPNPGLAAPLRAGPAARVKEGAVSYEQVNKGGHKWLTGVFSLDIMKNPKPEKLPIEKTGSSEEEDSGMDTASNVSLSRSQAETPRLRIRRLLSKLPPWVQQLHHKVLDKDLDFGLQQQWSKVVSDPSSLQKELDRMREVQTVAEGLKVSAKCERVWDVLEEVEQWLLEIKQQTQQMQKALDKLYNTEAFGPQRNQKVETPSPNAKDDQRKPGAMQKKGE